MPTSMLEKIQSNISHLEDTVLRYENCLIDNRHVAKI